MGPGAGQTNGRRVGVGRAGEPEGPLTVVKRRKDVGGVGVRSGGVGRVN